MLDLIAHTTEAQEWVRQAKAKHSHNGVFGGLTSSVIWSDETEQDDELFVPLDPSALVADINASGFSLLERHDPGFPMGKVLTAAAFTAPEGTRFVAALLGFYQGGNRIGFGDLGLQPASPVASPSQLPVLTDASWIEFCVDPRDVEPAWVEGVLSNAPMRIKQTELSHNAAEPLIELIRVGLPYAVLVWNPFVTAIATEAGKNVYAAVSRWTGKLLAKISELQYPIVEIMSHHGECQVSFIFRGKDVKRHYASHDALPIAAVKAAALVKNM